MEGKLKPINVIIGHLDNGLYIQKYQSDYAETNVNSYAYIKNKPNLDLKQDVITDLATIRAGAALGATALKVTISNPSDQQYEMFGWHKVVPAIPPAYDVDTQYIECHYEMSGADIIQVWEIHDIEQVGNNE